MSDKKPLEQVELFRDSDIPSRETAREFVRRTALDRAMLGIDPVNRKVGDVLFKAPQIMLKDPDTGGEKGSSLVRPDLIPVLPMAEVAFVFGRGALKYEDHNWRRGYKFSLSVAALERHFMKWKAGQTWDPDGFHHLGAVVFHALALMEFENTHPEKNDGYKEI